MLFKSILYFYKFYVVEHIYEQNLATKLIVSLVYNITQYLFIKGEF